MMDDIYDECQEKFPNVKLPRTIINTLYYAARLDQPKMLVAAFNDVPSYDACNYMLSVKFQEEDGQTFTPLAMAARYGSVHFIRTIISHYDVDLEQECDLIFDGIVVYGATPLWIASGMGHLSVVKFLLYKGANIDHYTKAFSTPLRAACYQGHQAIVSYLIKNGADVDRANIYNNTCLMISAYRGFVYGVITLLNNGADPNKQALCGATALHYAAECGHADVCKLLIEHGAKMIKNENGVIPPLLAADRLRESVVAYFVNESNALTKEEIIDVLELQGATYANDKDRCDANVAHKILLGAMTLRYEDPDNIIRKQKIPPVFAYDNWIETETLEELNAIRLNHHSIQMEGLTIRERILGKMYPELPPPICFRGAIFADQERPDRCYTMWSYAIDLKFLQNVTIERDLLRFSHLFSQIIRTNKPLDPKIVISILDRGYMEIENDRKRLECPGKKDDVAAIAEHLDTNINTALHLIKISSIAISAINGPSKADNIKELKAVTSMLVRSKARRRDGQTLLHRSVSALTNDEYVSNDLCRFPCLKTATLLVKAGASAMAVDSQRNTPLHLLIYTIIRPTASTLSFVDKIVELLINAGGHLDAVNDQGLTPVQMSTLPAVNEMLLKYQNKTLSLRCLAAHNIAFYKLPYQGVIPQTLETFMHMHGTEKMED